MSSWYPLTTCAPLESGILKTFSCFAWGIRNSCLPWGTLNSFGKPVGIPCVFWLKLTLFSWKPLCVPWGTLRRTGFPCGTGRLCKSSTRFGYAWFRVFIFFCKLCQVKTWLYVKFTLQIIDFRFLIAALWLWNLRKDTVNNVNNKHGKIIITYHVSWHHITSTHKIIYSTVHRKRC